MSYSHAPRLTRQSELILNARDFFKLRDAVDRLDPDIAIANLKSFPSFGATHILNRGKLVVRASVLDTTLKDNIRIELRDAFYDRPDAHIDHRLGKIDPESEFGKTSASLYVDELLDQKTGSLNILAKLFPYKELNNSIIGGVDICPHSELELVLGIARGVLDNISKILEMDEVTRLRNLFATLDLNLSRRGKIVDIAETVVSDIRDSPVENKPEKILSAIAEITQRIRNTVEYKTIDMLVCNKD